MKPRLPQVVLDTNVLVAGLRSRTGASHELLMLLFADAYQLHISVPVILQYEGVLCRHEHELAVDREEVQVILQAIQARSVHHSIHFLWRDVLPDPNDAAFLELAIAANARTVVTHNIRDFQGCEQFGIRAIPPLELLAELGV